MEFFTTHALVLRAAPYREASRMLTLLTADNGKISAAAHGTQSNKSTLRPAVQPLVFSEMTLKRQGDRYTLTEAHIVEQFVELTAELEPFALASYFAELVETIADEDAPTSNFLSLILNALKALCGKHDTPIVKAATELRAMCLAGFAPPLDRDTLGDTQLDDGAAAAMRHVAQCEPARLYAFRLGDPTLFAEACETYVLTQLERGFKTLDYYYKVKT
ncbi:MAG: DNA repair protein RecO [Oscillospiraceae bacterium]|jgi:DNA repair protein RecO (recombination protein O)|nr:DNA repair protein RecO [Oscillospiraceae bacterium]